MDFAFTEEQRCCVRASSGCWPITMASSAQALHAGSRRLEPRACGSAMPSSACSACRSPKSMAARRRPGRDHDRDGGDRPRAGARALSRDRRARRRLAPPRRRRGDARRLLPKIASGELMLAFAHAERQSRYDLADVATTARRDGAGYVLDGEKSLVLHGDSADKLVVSARLAGRPARPRRARRCSWSMPTRPAFPPAAIRPSTACAPPRSRWPACASAPTP